jgi:hypothetical protein
VDALSDRDILWLWEQAQDMAPLDRALAVLAVADPASTAVLARLPVAERDRRLMEVRQLTFGPDATALDNCPACHADLELALRLPELLRGAPEIEIGQSFRAVIHGRSRNFRLPDSLDIAEAVGAGEAETSARLLASRCLVVEEGGATPDLSDGFVASLAEAMLACHPHSECNLSATCPECGHIWQTLFDIGSFLWAELEDEAHRVTYEVHDLARAYGWREADILAMSRRRRRAYIEAAQT